MKKIVTILVLIPYLMKAQSNIGIGNANPTEKLHIDSGAVKIGNSIWNSSQNNWLKFGDGEYVRIGELGDDSLYIQSNYVRFENSSPSALTTLSIKGDLIIKNGTEDYNRVLTSIANTGHSEWRPLPSYNTGFTCNGGSNIPINSSNSPLLMPFNNEIHDAGNNFNSTANNYKYTCPGSGFYHFESTLAVSIPGGASSFLLTARIRKTDNLNNTSTILSYSDYILSTPVGTVYSIPLAKSLYLFAGESIFIDLSSNSPTNSLIQLSESNFSGFRVY